MVLYFSHISGYIYERELALREIAACHAQTRLRVSVVDQFFELGYGE